MADLPGPTLPQAAPADRPAPSFEVLSADSIERAAAPTLRFSARVGDESGIEVYTVALSVILTIEPGMRTYDPATRERLSELFGEPERWGSTTGAFRWAQVDVLVPSFCGTTDFEIRVPCTYDHEIAATKYFSGLADGVVPLRLHFNGTVIYKGADGRIQMMLLPWDLSVRYDLAVATWREMIANHYPEGAWVRVTDATLERLRRLKGARGAATFDATVAELLDAEHAGGDGPDA